MEQRICSISKGLSKIIFILILISGCWLKTNGQSNNFKWIILQAASTSGTDTYTATVSGISAYSSFQVLNVNFGNANTGAATLNINSLGAKSIKKNGTTALASGDISTGQIMQLIYDGTNFQILGGGGGSSLSATSPLSYNSGTGVFSFPTWPSNASGVLTNNGSGTLTWATAVSTFQSLTDGPGSFSGKTLNYSRVNAGETALEYRTPSQVLSDIGGQASLVSGTNIKTVNSNSLLGSGNVAVGDALVANPLSQFASTTSAQLAGVISNETGSGALVFATSPSLVTPALGVPASGDFSSGSFTWPTFNQNTTGSAAKWTTGRTLSITGDLTYTSPSFDGSGNVTAAGTITTGAVTDDKGSLLVKPAVAVVSTSNLTLSGEQTIDGQATSSSLVLLTGQTTGSENGPWVSASGAWSRPTWYTNGSTTQAPRFLTTFVRLGTNYQGTTWRMTTASVTIGTTATTWVETPLVLNSTSVTGFLPTANGGTGVDNSTGGTANQFWARPNGSTGAATYRAIVGADIPTLNQNTTGSAATLTTARTLWGQSFDGSASITGSLTSVGNITGGASNMTITAGTGNSRTLTLQSTTSGGTATTGLSIDASQLITFPAYTTNGGLLYTNASGVISQTAAGSSTTVLHGGTSPAYSAISLTADVSGTLPITNGGLGFATATQGDIIYSDAPNSLTKLAKSTTSTRYLSNTGTLNNPAWAQIDLTNGVTGTLPVGNGGTGITSLGSGVATWLGTPSWTNFNSAITGTAPYVSLATGGTATGTMTLTMGSNPFIFSTGVTTGTGATAGLQLAANSLTTGNALDISSSSATTGSGLKLTSTSTAINHTIGSNALQRIVMSGANGTSGKTTVAFESNVSNTGTSSTNVASVFNATGASNNYAILAPNGNVGIGTNTPSALLEVSLTDANTNGVNDALILTHTLISGTPAAGIGNTLKYNSQTTSGGATKNSLQLDGYFSDVTASSEDGTLNFKVMSNGQAPIDRIWADGNLTTLTESSATAFMRIDVPDGDTSGGSMTVTVNANDGTDFQSTTSTFTFDAVAKSGTITVGLSSVTQSTACSSGTLTVTITAVDSGSSSNYVLFKANAVSSLTQTTLVSQAQCRKNNRGTLKTQ